MGSRGNVSHIVTYNKKAASSQRVLVAFATTKPSGHRNLRQKSSIITKGAGEFGSLPNHKGCQCNTIESKAGQSHCTCHQKGVLDITYLTIHVDAGVMVFTQHKNLSPRRTCCRDILARQAKTHNTT
jgi:hypothetical protein